MGFLAAITTLHINAESRLDDARREEAKADQADVDARMFAARATQYRKEAKEYQKAAEKLIAAK